MEGRHFVHSGKLLKFSEQQLVDCDRNSGGCSGGNEDKAFDYYKNNDAMSEQAYPYKGRNGQCKAARGTGVHSKGHKNIQKNSPSAMKDALKQGPLSVAIEADKMVFNNYRSGIFDSHSCGTNLDHAVGLVGWGTTKGQDYWIVRNSWGRSWGESGYMRMAIESGKGICGI